MRHLQHTVIVVFLLTSCTKTIPVNMTSYDEKKLVAEGVITDKYEIQKFKITWTSDLGATVPATADDVILSVTTPSGPVSYKSSGNGIYESVVPFSGISGSQYTISFSRDGLSHEVTTTMPGELTIDSCRMVTTSSYPFGMEPSIYLSLSSGQKQYFRYDVFKLDKESLPDTVWTSVEVPVYDAFPLESGSQQIILNQINTGIYAFDTNDVARVLVYSLSQDVYNYLGKLKTFMITEPKGGKFENPPYYYTNGAYGLGYGTSVDTAYYFFQ